MPAKGHRISMAKRFEGKYQICEDIGTTKDNHDDMVSKGRGPGLKGENNPCSRLTAAQVREIMGLKGGRLSQEVVGKMYSVSRKTISSIWSGRTWSAAAPAEPRQNEMAHLYLSFGA